MKSFLLQVIITFCVTSFGLQTIQAQVSQSHKVIVWSKVENGYRVEYIKEGEVEYILKTPLNLVENKSQETTLHLFETSSSTIVPELQTDELISSRLKQMQSEISLEFNQEVKHEIYRLLKHKHLLEETLGRASYFMPMMKEKASYYQVPQVLGYLPLVESGYKSISRSSAGAKGVWQFIPSTAKVYGLQVNHSTDERLHPERSTDAAFRFLTDLYEEFGDWKLALSGYNAGPGRVKRALRQSAKPNPTFWDIKHDLPRETQKYVVKFIAAVYVMEFADQIGLQPNINGYKEAEKEVGTLHNLAYASTNEPSGEVPENSSAIYYEVKSGDNLGFIAEWYDVKTNQLRIWNQIDGNLIRVGQRLTVYVPTDKLHVYQNINQLTIDKIESVKKDTEIVMAKNIPAQNYIIKQGDTLWNISKKTGISIQRIIQLNNIENSKKLKPGTVLKLAEKL